MATLSSLLGKPTSFASFITARELNIRPVVTASNCISVRYTQHADAVMSGRLLATTAIELQVAARHGDARFRAGHAHGPLPNPAAIFLPSQPKVKREVPSHHFLQQMYGEADPSRRRVRYD